MRLHILGVCGTFMGSLAILAKELGYEVSGSDKNVYPPMSTQLEAQGITILPEGSLANLKPRPSLVIVGNALSRGQVDIEIMMNEGIPYVSGPEWLFQAVLQKKWVLAVAGTHGKTTTSSLLAWILEYAGLSPGFLIGGVPLNFGISGRLGKSDYFVVEADEYDSAFFDKRSKFVHYRPRTAILNNLEYDHADIFPDLQAIEKQFHHLVRSVPGKGCLIINGEDNALKRVLQMGCWTPQVFFGLGGGQWTAQLEKPNGSCFKMKTPQAQTVTIEWSLVGTHNVMNALAACAASQEVGVSLPTMAEALAQFKTVARRLQVCGTVHSVTVYDDFAHHPTAIATTIAGLRATIREGRIIAVLDLRSNSMKMGVHQHTLAPALLEANVVFIYVPPDLIKWDVALVTRTSPKAYAVATIPELITQVVKEAQQGDHILVMSNGSFDGIHGRLLAALADPHARQMASVI